MRGIIVVSLLSVGFASCSSIQRAAETDLISERDIVGALKCALSQALVREKRERKIKRLQGRVAKMVLDLKIVDTTNVSAGVAAKAAAGGPFVFALGSGTGSFLPSLSGGILQTNTINTKVTVRWMLYANNDEVCNVQSPSTLSKYRFSQWLSGVISNMDANSNYQPRGTLDQIYLNQTFGVTKTGKVGADLNIVFLDVSGSAEKSRNDVQNLELTIAAASKDFPAPNPGDSNLGPAFR